MAAIASRIAARPQSWAAGQADAMAILMRRTLMRTSAPILSSLRRMVPQLACANSVSCRPIRRRAHSSIGHRVEPQPQLVGPHRGSRGAVRIEVELTLLDPVLHVAAGAVDLLVQVLGPALVAPQRGDHEARI